jgi:hypothetical protein
MTDQPTPLTELALLAALPGWYAAPPAVLRPGAEPWAAEPGDLLLPSLAEFWLARSLLEAGLAQGGTILHLPARLGADNPGRRVLRARRTLAGDRRLQHLRESAKGE